MNSISSCALAVVVPLTLSAIFFAGPLYRMTKEPECAPNIVEQWREEPLPLIRNVVVAPVCEELVFRACVCPILLAGGWSVSATVLISPLLFGGAHMHHMLGMMHSRGMGLRESFLNACFQLSYTTVFGCLTGLLFLRSGHTISCILAHAFANSMGFPDLGWVNQVPPHPEKARLCVLFVGGIVAYALLFMPLTDPQLFGSFFYELAAKRQ